MGEERDYSNLSRAYKQKKRKKLKWLIVIISIFLLGTTTITGYASFKINELINKTSEPSNTASNENNKNLSASAKELAKEPMAILLLGEDYRVETGSKNTDAIIVSVINPDTEKVTLISIPRDTKVKIPGYGTGKINSVYAKGEQRKSEELRRGETPTTDGTQLLMEVLSDFLDIPINYYAKVDFKGFELIIDELGGLEIDVERDMVYYSKADNTNINLKQGLQTLNGKQALDYARFRKSSDGNDSNDFERNERHQKIIKALADNFISFNGVTNVFNILEISGDHIKTNLSPDQIKALLWQYKGISMDSFQTISMESYWKSPYVYVEEEELLRVQNELKKELGLMVEE